MRERASLVSRLEGRWIIGLSKCTSNVGEFSLRLQWGEKVRSELTIMPGDTLHFIYDQAVIGFLVSGNWISCEEVHCRLLRDRRSLREPSPTSLKWYLVSRCRAGRKRLAPKPPPKRQPDPKQVTSTRSRIRRQAAAAEARAHERDDDLESTAATTVSAATGVRHGSIIFTFYLLHFIMFYDSSIKLL